MMESALTLTNTPLDLQITICTFLHPLDILPLRKTCKALELVTRRRIIWVAALHRVCIDNTLFLPSFPIPNMSDLELERAAMAPRRWIELCVAFQKQHSNEYSEMLHPRTTRIIKELEVDDSRYFIVPGGRYLVTLGNGLCVWDLGYVSTVDCKLVASVGLVGELDSVQTTPDGMGLVILSTNTSDGDFAIFEIYPQDKIPLLTQIAHLERFNSDTEHLLPDTLICRVIHQDRIVFTVVNYRTNCSTCFSADVDVKKIDYVQIFPTETAIIVFSEEGVLIWAMPPLSPQPLDLRHFLDNNSTHIPPLLKIPYPDGIVRHTPILMWMTVSSWYFGSWESVYFDIFYKDSTLQRFKIVIKPDLSDVSLHFICMSEITSNDLMDYVVVDGVCNAYMIYEDALVYCWNDHKGWGAYAGLTSAPFTNIVTRWNGHTDSICPTSGRFVNYAKKRRVDGSLQPCRIDIADLF